MLRELSSWITLGVCTLFVELASNIFYIVFFPPISIFMHKRKEEGEREGKGRKKEEEGARMNCGY